jgi:hypothetical protein
MRPATLIGLLVLAVIVLGALVLAGCFSPSYHSGGVACGHGTQPCPDGYHCAVDRLCWKNGEDPDLATGSPADLSLPPADLSLPPADLSTPGDLAPPPPDLTGFDGHVVQPLTTACGGGVKAAGSKHSVTLSVGQKTSGIAAGTAHKLQLGVLHGTQAK